MNNQFSLKQEQSLPCNSRSGVYSKHFYKGQYREDGGIGRLDCHGLSHKAALRKIERGISRLLFYRTTECFEVITGNSPKMREVLFDLCDEMGAEPHYPLTHNNGRFIIRRDKQTALGWISPKERKKLSNTPKPRKPRMRKE